MTIDADAFRAALGQLASGVCVVTMRADDGDHGFTATSVTSVSLSPMLVLVCVAKNQTSHGVLEQTGHFAINMLAHDQAELGMRFATALVEERFDGLEVTRAATGAPLLPGTLAWLDCITRQILPGGDHSILVGEVQASYAQEEGRPLLYYRRQWGGFLPG